MNINRRDFLKSTSVALAAAALSPGCAPAEPVNGIPYRALGRTGEKVSLLGLGGYHLGMEEVPEQDAIAMMHHAADNGINFFDNAWEYFGGRAEERMGKGLKGGYRDKVILMTKVIDRTKEGAQTQLEDSLRRLDVDHIDLWQLHAITTMEDVEAVKNGALETAIKARDEGKVRFIGFTGHADPAVHLAMLDLGFDFDTIQMPLGVLDYHFHSFAQQVVPVAQKKEMGIIAMKTLCGNASFLETGQIEAAECLRYSMDLPLSVMLSGMDSMEVLKKNIELARNYQPLAQEERETILAKAAGLGADGKYEFFKTASGEAWPV